MTTVFCFVPAVRTLATTVSVTGGAAGAIGPMCQVSVAWSNVPWLADTDTIWRPVGIGPNSSTVTSGAASGPWL
jgi:hypothetical protein